MNMQEALELSWLVFFGFDYPFSKETINFAYQTWLELPELHTFETIGGEE